jgi:proteasome lid subunit RPN8/RPN11
MPTASVAYEARPRRRRAREDSQDDYLGRVRQTLMALGSNNPDGDLNATGDYWQKLRGQGIEPGIAGALVYATARHRHPASSQLREGRSKVFTVFVESRDDDDVTVHVAGKGAALWAKTEHQSIAGSRWEADGPDFAYAVISNSRNLPEELKADGYHKLNLDQWSPPRTTEPYDPPITGPVHESPTRDEWEVVVRRTAAVDDIVAAAGRKPDEIAGNHLTFGDFYDDEKATAFARKMTQAGFIATSGARRQVAAEAGTSTRWYRGWELTAERGSDGFYGNGKAVTDNGRVGFRTSKRYITSDELFRSLIDKIDSSTLGGEDRPALRWAEVWWKDPSDAERFAKLLEKINGEVVATADNRIVTTNATAADIAKTIRKHRWKDRHSLTSSMQRYDKAAEGGGMDDDFQTFSSWPEVLKYANSGAPLYYWAPMDHRPIRVHDFEVRARSIRIWPSGSRGRGRGRTSDPFTADSGHMDRFRRPASGAREARHRGGSDKKAEWMREYQKKAESFGVTVSGIDWNDAEYLYSQGLDAKDAARKKYGPKSNPLTEVAPCTRPHRTPVDSECAALAKSIGPIRSDKELYKLCAPRMRKEPQEVFYVVCVDVHGELCGFTEVARGQVSSVNVEPEQVLQAVLAIQPRPTGYAVAHNHPSGKAMPSAADRKLTEEIKRAGAVACPNVAFMDHLVLGSNEYYSFTEKKLKRA